MVITVYLVTERLVFYDLVEGNFITLFDCLSDFSD